MSAAEPSPRPSTPPAAEPGTVEPAAADPTTTEPAISKLATVEPAGAVATQARPAQSPGGLAAPEVPPLFPRWTGPAGPVTRRVLTAALVVGLTGAVAVPWTSPGIGWPVLGLVTAVAVVAAVRPFSSSTVDRDRLATAGWAVAALLLLAAVGLRAAPWLGLLCVATATGCAALAITGGRTTRGLFLAVLALPAAAFRSLPWAGRGIVRGRPEARIGRLIMAVTASVVLLVVFAALFASADPVFSEVVAAVTPRLDAGSVGRWLFSVLLLAPATVGACYLAAAPPPVDRDGEPVRTWWRLEWALPVGTLVVVFAMFVGVQATVLFGGAGHVLRTERLTFAEYARGGFWQLLVVTVLTLLIMAVVARKAVRSSRFDQTLLRILLGALAGLSLVVVASALYRMWTYEQAYGFSVLRLLVSACELWLGVVFVLVLAAGIRLSVSARWLPRTVVATGVLTLLGLVALNPDRLVAERNIDRYHQINLIDLDYLATLSLDAVPALDRLPEPERSCVLDAIRSNQDVFGTDGPRGWTLGQYRAEQILATRPARPGGCG